MKFYLAALIVLISAVPALASPQPTKQCLDKAINLLKFVVPSDPEGSEEDAIQYGLTGYDGTQTRDTITVTAGPLNGDDSDTYIEYAIAFRKGPISQTCYVLESMTLVGEN